MGSIDLKMNEEADANIIVKPEETWIEQEKSVLEEARKILNDHQLDAVICVAGGWAGGNSASKDFIKNADLMWKQSVWSSSIAASLAAKHLKQGLFLKEKNNCIFILNVVIGLYGKKLKNLRVGMLLLKSKTFR